MLLDGDICSQMYLDNDDTHGYMDLLLISRCQHQITSKGTLGKFGAMFGNQKGKIVVDRDDENIAILKAMDFPYVLLQRMIYEKQ